MAKPLTAADPVRLGPFRVVERLEEAPAGIVYSGVDESGRLVRLVVLNRGAASDPVARGRFRTAITRAAGTAGGEPYGTAPWVALWADGPSRAREFLSAAAPALTAPASDHGPVFQPYWAGSHDPALAAPAHPGARRDRVPGPIAGSVVALATLAVILAVALGVLLGCQPSVKMPVSPPTDTTAPLPQPTEPLPTRPVPNPTGQPTPSLPVPSPRPSDSGPGDGGGAGAA